MIVKVHGLGMGDLMVFKTDENEIIFGRRTITPYYIEITMNSNLLSCFNYTQ